MNNNEQIAVIELRELTKMLDDMRQQCIKDSVHAASKGWFIAAHEYETRALVYSAMSVKVVELAKYGTVKR